MTAIARGSVTRRRELARFTDDERRGAGRSSAAPGRALHGPTLPKRAAFWLLAAVLCLLFVATAAPAPLYGVYQAEWHFSVTTLTAVFAVYAFVLLVTLLMFGSVSDYFGRRRTIVQPAPHPGPLPASGARSIFRLWSGRCLIFHKLSA